MGAMAEMTEGLAGGLGVMTSPVAAQSRLVAMAERFLQRQLELVDGVIERSPRRTPCLAWVSTGSGRPKCWTDGDLPGWMNRLHEVSFASWGGGAVRRCSEPGVRCFHRFPMRREFAVGGEYGLPHGTTGRVKV
jgi:hypothetical protein